MTIGEFTKNSTESSSTHKALDTISRQEAIDGKISIQRSNGLEVYSDEAVPVEYLKSLPSTQPDYKTDHGFMWLCPKCGLPVHSDFEKCVRCGYER